ncbi:glutamate receptor ionotropic, delta-2-like [Nylanderia fulva]|uniref:glutamate receptor ionotropic, delta-2-like n=1 Tax=Nylanderia fulva TaxID=613905 RepID=UPI0010FB9E10|nr:glutamate receptor ionotropic, delta-2-like [Nylanderia fulva]
MLPIVLRKAKFIQIMLMVVHIAAKPCFFTSPLTLQMVLEYAEWRSWNQVVLFDNISPFSCALSYVRPLIKCFGGKGISVSLQSATNPNIPDALTIPTHRIGSIVFLDGLNLTSPDNVIQVASQKFLFNYYISWLMVTTRNTDSTIDTVLRDLNIGIDSDVVVATSPLLNDDVSWKYAQKYREKICRSFQRYGDRFEFMGPPKRRNVENATINLNYVTLENRSVSFYLVNTYKIRHSDNASLIVRYLGFWNPDSHTLKPPMSVKLRSDFRGLPIIFGVLNGTSDGQTDIAEAETTANDIAPLLDFATIVTNSVNASIELIPHEKLGTLTNKVWSHLLGDVVAGTVDIGLGYITSNDEERWTEMTFSHPLIRYTRNIYYHPLETGTMRDIFLQPFDNRLLGCVAATYFIMLIAMATVIYATKAILHKEERYVGIGESALWCLSIMCMQGSPWSPRTPSGKTLLLFSLIFSLVMYNAYAGFITSILSVQVTGIKSITDLLLNNFKLGYSAADDAYIRNANDSNLRQLYIKAFNSRESRLETRTGLMKAVKGRYGFFVSATLARRALRTTFIQERCLLKELLLPKTLTVVALPMAKSCPYRKIINLNILRIYERGVLDKIQERMLPTMPRCAASAAFHSARLTDVYSAFFLLTAGMVIAISIGIVERIWNKRKQMQETIVRSLRDHHLIPHINFHHQHHRDRPNDRLHFQSPDALSTDRPRDYNSAYLTMLQNQARQVQSFIGFQERDTSPEKSRGPGQEPRFHIRRSAGLKRASWASFTGLSKRKLKETEKIPPPSNVGSTPGIRILPFHN